MKIHHFYSGLVVLAVVSMASLDARAQRPEISFPVIVVYRADVSLGSSQGDLPADERAATHPEAWNYLDRKVVAATARLEARHGFRANHVYSAALRGFSGHLNARQIKALANDPLVAYIETDGAMNAVAQILPWGIDALDADLSSVLAGNGSGTLGNVNVYVIDTGIDIKHTDLSVVKHVNFAGGTNTDCNGHGTHVAGTVSARDNTIDVVGVAPGAALIGVKVLGCSGSGWTSGVIKGIDYVTANAVKPAIANLSLGGSANASLDAAVKKSADSGVFYSIAAGNSGADACTASPARAGTHAGVMTIAAIDINGIEPSWSNYGSCVDAWAPGASILSTKKGGGTTTYSGTSMAAPHAGGAGALYLSSQPAANAAAVENALKSDSVVTGRTSKDGRDILMIYTRWY